MCSVCVTNVTIEPQKDVVEVGDNFTCSSNSDPDATYTWTASPGTIVAIGNTAQITSTGQFTLTCKAAVIVNDTEYCYDTATVSGEAIGMYQLYISENNFCYCADFHV